MVGTSYLSGGTVTLIMGLIMSYLNSDSVTLISHKTHMSCLRSDSVTLVSHKTHMSYLSSDSVTLIIRHT